MDHSGGEEAQPHQWSKKFLQNQNGYYLIFPSFVPEGDLWELGETKGTRIIKNEVHLVLKINLHTSGKR
jgi:hypothetical protein